MLIRSGRHIIIPPDAGLSIVSTRMAAAAASPNSLSYNGSAYTDCGTGASILGLNQGLFTVDVYWQCSVALAAYIRYDIINQWAAGVGGWKMNFYVNGNPYTATNAGYLECFLFDGGGVSRGCAKASWTYVLNSWYYLRYRRISANSHECSVNASAGAAGYIVTAGGTVSANALLIGKSAGYQSLKGNICYVHIWNTNKGALAAVPTSPFPVDANTVARYTHSDGAGLVLSDSSGNGNNGTLNGATWSATVPVGWTLS